MGPAEPQRKSEGNWQGPGSIPALPLSRGSEKSHQVETLLKVGEPAVGECTPQYKHNIGLKGWLRCRFEPV